MKFKIKMKVSVSLIISRTDLTLFSICHINRKVKKIKLKKSRFCLNVTFYVNTKK